MNKISIDMVDAIKVKFITPIFEDDFPEKGMTAWLTDVEWDEKTSCYRLYFDFKDFEAENDKYFKEQYYANMYTGGLPKKNFYTAKETGNYNSKYNVLFSGGWDDRRNDEEFSRQIVAYLKVIE